MSDYKVKNLEDLKTILQPIAYRWYKNLIITMLAGDPDWLWDLVSELDHITSRSGFYIPEFHGNLKRRGYTSKDFDCATIWADVQKLKLSPIEQAKLDKLKSEL